LLSNLAFLRPATNCLNSDTVTSYLWTQRLWSIWSCIFFFRGTWSVALKGAVTLKVVERKVMGKMFVSKRSEGTGESCIMKRFMMCTHQLYTGCFTTCGHYCRGWFPRPLWSKKFI
jgi:hypothetical protein